MRRVWASAAACVAVLTWGGCSSGSGGELDAEAVAASPTGAAAFVAGDADPGTAGVTVVGTGEVTVEADTAFVVIATDLVDVDGLTISERDRSDIVESLGSVGIESDAVDIEATSIGYGSQIVIRVDIAQLPDVGERIERAVEDVIGSSGDAGA
jgi:hypothetical protein